MFGVFLLIFFKVMLGIEINSWNSILDHNNF